MTITEVKKGSRVEVPSVEQGNRRRVDGLTAAGAS